MKSASHNFSVEGTATIVFIVINLMLSNSVASGGNMDFSFGWIDFHSRHGLDLSVTYFSPLWLAASILMSVSLAWCLLKLSARPAIA
ncbi:MAG TPA: hypothetical protein VH413_04805 [Verrucomicrobiae bacterium]|jgi:hypothetical protein|nr:hypothetical protein [Verrucomicrobiae bacterium]